MNAATQRIENEITSFVLELKLKLPEIISQTFEDSRALVTSAGQNHSASALNCLPRHHNLTLQTYMANMLKGSSIFSGRSTTSGPSMQISSLRGSQGKQSASIYLSVYVTAKIQFTGTGEDSTIARMDCDDMSSVIQATEIWIKTLTGKVYKLAYRADMNIDELKFWLYGQGEFPPRSQELSGVANSWVNTRI